LAPIPGADCLANSFSFERFTSIVDKRRRASELANPQDQLGRMVECCAVFCPWAAVQVGEVDAAGVHCDHIVDTSLRCPSLSQSMYRWVVWIDRVEKTRELLVC
jgi:hypothetical protein